MSVITQNIALIEGAKAYVREVAESLAQAGVEPRFDIDFEGFGMGGTSDLPAEFATRYLDDLAGASGPHHRYRTKIKNVSVSVHVKDKNFSA